VLKHGRTVLWNFDICDKVDGISLRYHRPERRNIALECTEAWEGETCCYISAVKDGDIYRLYYRASSAKSGFPGIENSKRHGVVCVAESRDGKIFTRPNVGIYDYGGTKDNNIVFTRGEYIDNFSVWLDENPDCPKDARYKALSLCGNRCLAYYKSADGLHFLPAGLIPVTGTFDSLNLITWDKDTKKYRIYFRYFHHTDGSEPVKDEKFDESTGFRDVRYTESEDFETWSEPVRIAYSDGKDSIQYYTSGITKYHRADAYYGIPTRYADRINDMQNFRHLSDLDGKRMDMIEKLGRIGSAVTDSTFIHSCDGKVFTRSSEPFITPGIENGINWIYGDCYISRGNIETSSDFANEPNELAFYTVRDYGMRESKIVRYALRLDGFCSWHADSTSGSILTRSFVWQGSSMDINFATSALGSLRIIICNKDGIPLSGYDSTSLFGDSIERPVDFEKPLSELYGKEVRLRIEMSECDLWSMNIL